MTDCPECEYCCLIGLCCPTAAQRAALVTLFLAGGSSQAAAERHADMVVEARLRAMKS